MAQVFVSHASVDGALAERVRGWLVGAGHEVFLDRHPQDGITPGEDWERRLRERLRAADAVVCLVTSAYCRSSWCTAEVVIARDRGALLLPVVAEPGVRQDLLRPVQDLDLTSGEVSVRERLDAVLREIDVTGGRGWPDDRSPYPGLDPLGADRHRAFFGRADDVRRLASTLRTQDAQSEPEVLVVVGPSGCGKSSLVRAGLAPAVGGEPDAWALAPCRPGGDPLGAVLRGFAVGFHQLGRERTIEDLRRQACGGRLADVAHDLLLAISGELPTRLLLVVDQLEELLTQADGAARAEFVQAILPALGRPLQVVATLRPEFVDRLLSTPELADLPVRIHTITPLRREGLRAVVVEPARLAEIEIEDGLTQRLVDDTGTGEALPLLAYALAQLTENAAPSRVYRHARLTHQGYDLLEGVRGALRQRADEALAAAVRAGGRDRDAVIRELLRLVVVDDRGRPVRWQVSWSELTTPADRELDAFIVRRLLTTSTDPTTDDVVVEVAHEAILTAWPPLAGAVERESRALRARQRVEQAATDWDTRARATDGLWERGQLAGAVADIGTGRGDLSPRARDFLQASVTRDRVRRGRAVAVLSVLLLVAVVGGLVAIVQAQRAEAAQRDAVARQLLTQADAARASDTRSALRLGLAAARISPGPAATANLVDTLTHTRYARTLPHTTGVVTTAYSANGRTVATGDMDGRVTLWNLTDPNHPTQIGGVSTQRGYLYDVTFSPDGRTLATAGADGTVGLWDATDPTSLRRLGVPLRGHAAEVHGVAFSPDGRRLASVGFDDRLILWDVTDPARPTTTADIPTGHVGRVFDVAFSPDGRALATAGADRTVRLWTATDPSRPAPLGAPLVAPNAVWSAKFAPHGATVSAVDQSGELMTWAADGSSRPVGAPLAVHAGPAYELAFSPDGTMVATAGADRQVGLFSAADLSRPTRLGEPLSAHTDQVYSVAFAPDGRRLVSGGADRTAVMWDVVGPPHPELRSTLATGDPPGHQALAVAPSGRLLATGGPEPAVRLWDVDDPSRPRPIAAPVPVPATVRSLAISSDGRVLAAGGADGSVALLALDGPDAPRTAGVVPAAGGAAQGVAFAPAGNRLAVTHDDGSVALWDVAHPQQATPDGAPGLVHTGPVYAVAFSADGRTLATAGAEGAVLTWDIGADGLHAVPPGLIAGGAPQFAVAFAPGGVLANGGWDGLVLVWDRTSPDTPRRTLAPGEDGGAVYAVGFSGDGGLFAAAGASGSVTLWDVAVPTAPRNLGPASPTAGAPIDALGFPPGRSWFAAAGEDGVIGLWDVSALDDLRAHTTERACAIVGSGLDEAAWAAAVPGLGYEDTCPGETS